MAKYNQGTEKQEPQFLGKVSDVGMMGAEMRR